MKGDKLILNTLMSDIDAEKFGDRYRDEEIEYFSMFFKPGIKVGTLDSDEKPEMSKCVSKILLKIK